MSNNSLSCSSFLWYGWMDAWMATITIDSFTFLFFFLKLNYCNIIFKGHHLCNFGCHNSFNSCKRMPLYYKYIMFYISRNSILWDAKEVICFWSYFFKSIYWHVGTLNCFFFFFHQVRNKFVNVIIQGFVWMKRFMESNFYIIHLGLYLTQDSWTNIFEDI